MCFYPVNFIGCCPPVCGWQGIVPRRAEIMAARSCELMIGGALGVPGALARRGGTREPRDAGRSQARSKGGVDIGDGKCEWNAKLLQQKKVCSGCGTTVELYARKKKVSFQRDTFNSDDEFLDAWRAANFVKADQSESMEYLTSLVTLLGSNGCRHYETLVVSEVREIFRTIRVAAEMEPLPPIQVDQIYASAKAMKAKAGMGVDMLSPVDFQRLPGPAIAELAAGASANEVSRSAGPELALTRAIPEESFFRELQPVLVATTAAVLERLARSRCPQIWQTLPAYVKEELKSKVLEMAPTMFEPVLNDIKANINTIVDVKQMAIEILIENRRLLVEMFQQIGAREFTFIQHFSVGPSADPVVDRARSDKCREGGCQLPHVGHIGVAARACTLDRPDARGPSVLWCCLGSWQLSATCPLAAWESRLLAEPGPVSSAPQGREPPRSSNAWRQGLRAGFSWRVGGLGGASGAEAARAGWWMVSWGRIAAVAGAIPRSLAGWSTAAMFRGPLLEASDAVFGVDQGGLGAAELEGNRLGDPAGSQHSRSNASVTLGDAAGRQMPGVEQRATFRDRRSVTGSMQIGRLGGSRPPLDLSASRQALRAGRFILGAFQMCLWMIINSTGTEDECKTHAGSSKFHCWAGFVVLPVSGLIIGYPRGQRRFRRASRQVLEGSKASCRESVSAASGRADLTNWLGINLIFKPVWPHLYCGGYVNFQGVFLKRQKEVSQQMTQMICSKLVTARKMLEYVVKREEILKMVEDLFKKHVEEAMNTQTNAVRPLGEPLPSHALGRGVFL
ncbi:unnamed protein product [Prorocentrum cordatum]|uniref:Uncharacterized protein n=1 Tax=Prorocentrum cordatum TaxID=2364126 RepID=A0ABN9SW34_9DINO|nr:unnamed protein product [Polarella glacialis]